MLIFDFGISKYTSKAMETVANQVYHPNILALQDTLYAIGGKWKVPIIASICSGNTRFKEIERSIPGLTKRSLSKELKELEINLFITRTTYPDIPMKAEYKFTPYAKSLIPVITEMANWGIQHRKKIAKAPAKPARQAKVESTMHVSA